VPAHPRWWVPFDQTTSGVWTDDGTRGRGGVAFGKALNRHRQEQVSLTHNPRVVMVAGGQGVRRELLGNSLVVHPGTRGRG
jgi:hypothetical protein